jgi:poly(A) polymerase
VMSEIGLLNIEDAALRALATYDSLGGQSALTRLALLAGDRLPELQTSWRLSNESIAGARAIASAASLMTQDRIGEAAYRYGGAAVEGLAAAAASGQWSLARLAESARMLGALVVPPFPVSGHDLTGLGYAPGPGLGQDLARLERAWIESGFALGKAELLALLG